MSRGKRHIVDPVIKETNDVIFDNIIRSPVNQSKGCVSFSESYWLSVETSVSKTTNKQWCCHLLQRDWLPVSLGPPLNVPPGRRWVSRRQLCGIMATLMERLVFLQKVSVVVVIVVYLQSYLTFAGVSLMNAMNTSLYIQICCGSTTLRAAWSLISRRQTCYLYFWINKWVCAFMSPLRRDTMLMKWVIFNDYLSMQIAVILSSDNLYCLHSKHQMYHRA